jgi:hypothetical protein
MLFDVKKLEAPAPMATGDAGHQDQCAQLHPGTLKLQDVVSLVDHGRTVHFVSAGDWSMHHLLEKLLELTGPANVHLSSYAFGEAAARRVADCVASGTIKELYCLVDSRIDVRSASSLAIVRNVATAYKLLDTHAKVTVITNDTWRLVVIGSANYTGNKRYEAGVITTDAGAVDFHLKWMQDELARPR